MADMPLSTNHQNCARIFSGESFNRYRYRTVLSKLPFDIEPDFDSDSDFCQKHFSQIIRISPYIYVANFQGLEYYICFIRKHYNTMFTFNHVNKGNAMNILQKLDRIDPPYSTLLSLIVCILVGLGFRVFRPESGSLGLGIIVGAIFSILFKKAAECSDKAVWAALTGKTEPKE